MSNYLRVKPRVIFSFWIVFFFGITLAACLGKNSNQPESVKFQQYFVQGEILYTKHCSNCHQQSGKGLGLVYPPLSTSDYMEKNLNKVFCLMKYGIEGEINVNGLTYNKAMPGVPSLTELEMAEISTYIYNTWDHKRGLIETSEVINVIDNCAH